MRAVLDELEELPPEPFADFQLRARKHLPVLSHNRVGDVQPGRFGDGQQENGALKSVWFEGCRYDDVGIYYQPQRNHRRRVLCARAAPITWSICRDVKLSVP